jgi:hypothetical protein
MLRDLPQISEMILALFIGNADCTYNSYTLKDNNITAVVSIVNIPFNLWRRSKSTDFIISGSHLWIESVDSSTQDLLIHVGRICDFINQMLLLVQQPTLARSLQQSKETHCGARTSLQYPGGPYKLRVRRVALYYDSNFSPDAHMAQEPQRCFGGSDS